MSNLAPESAAESTSNAPSRRSSLRKRGSLSDNLNGSKTRQNKRSRTRFAADTKGGPGLANKQRSSVNRLAIDNQLFAPVTQKYQITEYIGHGSYGDVYGAISRATGEKVAIKRIRRVRQNITYARRLLRELRILRLLDHSSICEVRELVAPVDLNTFSDLFVVFEFVDTDMQKLMRSPQFLTSLHIKFFLYQILLGVQYMHTSQITHRDLKPSNILVNADCSIKICDFGLARGNRQEVPSNDTSSSPLTVSVTSTSPSESRTFTPSPNQASVPANNNNATSNQAPTSSSAQKRRNKKLTHHVSTRWYRAPEIILMSHTYDDAIDMWSVGCILADLMSMEKGNAAHWKSRKPLFPGKSCFPLSPLAANKYDDRFDQMNVIFRVVGTPAEEEIKEMALPEQAKAYLRKIAKDRPEKGIDLATQFPSSEPLAVDLLSRLLVLDPAKRMTVQEALRHDFLKEVVSPELERHSVSVPIDFEFETDDISDSEILRLIVEEIVQYNPEEQARRQVTAELS